MTPEELAEARRTIADTRRRIIEAGDKATIRHLEELERLAEDPEFWKQDFPSVTEQMAAHEAEFEGDV